SAGTVVALRPLAGRASLCPGRGHDANSIKPACHRRDGSNGLLGYAPACGQFFRNPRRTKGRGQPPVAGVVIALRSLALSLRWRSILLRNTKVLMSALLAAVLVAGGLLALHWAQPPSAGQDGGASGGFAGRVQGAGSPIAGSTVTLYAAGDGKPTQLAQGKS